MIGIYVLNIVRITADMKTVYTQYISTNQTFPFFEGPRRNLRNDLLIAADSITNTMSSLVKELNSGKKIEQGENNGASKGSLILGGAAENPGVPLPHGLEKIGVFFCCPSFKI